MSQKKQKVLLTIQAGAGGLEATDWAGMLWRMYFCWAERTGREFKALDYSNAFKSVWIQGLGVLGALKGEVGVHRLVRVSPFDPQRRRHTSFARVSVLGERHTMEQRWAAFGVSKKDQWTPSIRSYVVDPAIHAHVRNHEKRNRMEGAFTHDVRSVLDGGLDEFLGSRK
jgi:protein subunit release factor B